jgi:hypothetical protein
MSGREALPSISQATFTASFPEAELVISPESAPKVFRNLCPDPSLAFLQLFGLGPLELFPVRNADALLSGRDGRALPRDV